MLIEQVDAVGLQPLQRGLGHRLDIGGPAVEPGLDLAVPEAELGGDHHLVAERRERLTRQLLVDEGAISLGGVEQGHAAFERGPDHRNRLRRLGRGAVAIAQSHAAEAEGRDLKTALAQFARLHRSSPLKIMFGNEFRPRGHLRLGDKIGTYS